MKKKRKEGGKYYADRSMFSHQFDLEKIDHNNIVFDLFLLNQLNQLFHILYMPIKI